jgi:hypothetical protein
LQVLADFSWKTQVILFTHHARLLDLAQQVSLDGCVFTHDLRAAVPV